MRVLLLSSQGLNPFMQITELLILNLEQGLANFFYKWPVICKALQDIWSLLQLFNPASYSTLPWQ